MKVYSRKKLAVWLLLGGVYLLNCLVFLAGKTGAEKLTGVLWAGILAGYTAWELPAALSEETAQKRKSREQVLQLAWERQFGRFASVLLAGIIAAFFAAYLSVISRPDWSRVGILYGIVACATLLLCLVRGTAQKIEEEETARAERGES